jgi:hypothetical protein
LVTDGSYAGIDGWLMGPPEHTCSPTSNVSAPPSSIRRKPDTTPNGDPRRKRHGDRGEKRRPSRDTVIRLGLAMQLPIEDLNELLLAAGYAPLVS